MSILPHSAAKIKQVLIHRYALALQWLNKATVVLMLKVGREAKEDVHGSIGTVEVFQVLVLL